MREADLEKKLVAKVEALGGTTYKMNGTGQRGWPDRLVVLPGNSIGFAELKRPKGGVVSATQRAMYMKLASLGALVVGINSEAQIDNFLAGLQLNFTKLSLWPASSADADEVD